MKILVVSSHTDDAELGAGGSIIRFLDEGHEIMWVTFSIAEDSLPKGFPKNALKKEFMRVLEYLKIKKYKIFNFRVRHLHKHRQSILDSLIKIRDTFSPNLVLTTSQYDFHQDHKIVTEETIRAFKNSASILGYELPWNHLKFSSTFFVKLKQEHLDKKYHILQFYKTQIAIKKMYFSKEFIYSLANVRGVQCQSHYAESFEIIRWII
jgi:LmbE family N-acetylglucosaminyl deacetylase